MYSLGCSLIHFALFICMLFVQMPDVEKGIEFDTQLKNDYLALGEPINESFANFCGDKAIELQGIMNYLRFVHFFCFFTTSYREIYDVGVSNFALLMKGVEVFSLLLYIGAWINAVNAYT